MKNRRNIRKRNFEANKYLKLYRDYEPLYNYISGDGTNTGDFNAWEVNEKYEHEDKICALLKKKKRIPIPEINTKNDKGDNSEKSANTDVTKEYLRHREEDVAPVEFKFKPMGPPPISYIKYKPKME